MDDNLDRFCCLNPDCPDHGRRGQGNLRVGFRYGPNKRRRMLVCRTCQARFSERKGTPPFDARLPDDQVVSVLEHLRERCGVRQTGRLTGVSTNTVVRYARRAGDHAQQLHDELVGFPPDTREVELDEKWSFVGKKEKHCDRDDPGDDWSGDCWDHVAFDPEHRLVVSLVVGRQAEGLTLLLVEDFHRRTGGRLMDRMTSDENPAYAAAIREVYGEEVVAEPTGKPGRPPAPHKELPQGLNYSTVHKEREGGRVTSVEARVLHGAAEPGEVCTSHVERYNGTDRNQNGRKVRKAYTFSKDWEVHAAVSVFVAFSYNFCWPVRTLRQGSRRGGYRRRTPAMAAGLADHLWSLREWLTFPGADRTRAIVRGD